MDIQVYDTYFVFSWSAWLPVLFAGLLLGVFIWTAKAGLAKTYVSLLTVLLALLLSLSVWVSDATVVSTTLLSNPPAGVGQNWLLMNLHTMVIAGQVVLAGFVIWLGGRVQKILQRSQ